MNIEEKEAPIDVVIRMLKQITDASKTIQDDALFVENKIATLSLETVMALNELAELPRESCRDALRMKSHSLSTDASNAYYVARGLGGVGMMIEDCLDILKPAITDSLCEAKSILAAPLAERESLINVLNRKNLELNSKLKRRSDHPLHDSDVRNQVWALTGGKCFYCKVSLVANGEDGDRSCLFVIDHIVPKSLGGPDHLSNYVPACCKCNGAKSDKHFAAFVLGLQKPQLFVVTGPNSEDLDEAANG